MDILLPIIGTEGRTQKAQRVCRFQVLKIGLNFFNPGNHLGHLVLANGHLVICMGQYL